MDREELNEMSSFPQIRRVLLKENIRCELCGSRRGLDVHHIIPRCVGGDDKLDNLIVICSGCHGKLTPKSMLTRIGLHKAKCNGKQLGQKTGAKLVTKKSIRAKEIIKEQSIDFDGTLSDADVMKLIGCARGSYYKYKRELKGV